MIDARLRAVVAREPDRTAVIFGERRLGYRELNDRTAALRGGLARLGVGPGDRVLIVLPNCPEFVIGYFATAGLRAEVQALDPDLTAEEILARTTDCEPAVVITDTLRAPLLERLGATWRRAPALIVVGGPRPGVLGFDTLAVAGTRSPDDSAAAPEPSDGPWVLTHSSGSTGEPKRIRRSQANQLAEADNIASTAGITPDDVILCPVPLFHALGQFCCMIVSVLVGATLVLVEPQESGDVPDGAPALDVGRILGLLREHRATVFPAVPYLLGALADWPADQEADLSSVRLCLSGSNFLAPGVQERFLARFGVPVRQTYGSSEAGSVSWDCGPGPVVPESVGRPLNGVRVEILDDRGRPLPPGETGEIAVTSGSVMTGYAGQGEPRGPADGRHLTGDLGRLGPDGRLYVTGRKRILVDTGGHKVNPVEVEEVLEAHPDVAEAAVVGLPLGGGGDLLVAAVVPHGALDATRLAAHCAERLTGYKVPARFVSVEEIPRTPLGKVRRAALAALLAAQPEPGAPPAADDIRSEPDPEVRTRLIAGHVLRCVAALTGAVPEEHGPQAALRDLGLDSLRALRLKMALEDSLRRTVPLHDLLSGTTVEALARQLAEQTGELLEPLAAEGRTSGEFPLSANQLSIWHADRLAPESAAYNQSFAARITSGCDVDALRRAFQDLVDRHPVLRTTFGVRGGEPFQHVAARARADFRVIDTVLDPGLAERELSAEAFRPFALETEYPLRVRLYTGAGAGGPVLLVTSHHIASDFWSLVTMLRDLETSYTAAVTGEEIYRPPQPHTYTDYARWHTGSADGPVGERDWAHWREVLRDPPPALELPLDKPRPVVQAQHGATYFHDLGQDAVKELEAFAHDRGTTVYTVLLAVFHVLLHACTGERDIALAAITTNRQRREFQDVLGYFVNPVVCRTPVDPDEPFEELLGRVRGSLLEGLEHRTLPFERIVERLGLRRDRSRAPLVEVAFGQNKAHDDAGLAVGRFLSGGSGRTLSLGDLALESVALRQRGVVYDLSAAVYEASDSVALAWEYSTELFDEPTVVRLAAQFENVLRAVLRAPLTPVGRVEVLDAETRDGLLAASRGGPGPENPRTVTEETLRHAAALPDVTAVEADGELLTRGELVRRAAVLADRVRATRPGPDAVAVVWLPPTADLAVAGLGAMMASVACDPVGADSPPDRVRAVAAEGGAHLVVTTASGRERLGALGLPVVCVDGIPPAAGEDLPGEPDPVPDTTAGGRPAVIQRTSGVTGPPRATELDHLTLATWAQWLREQYGPLDGVLVHGSLAPDRMLARLLAVLATGGRAVLTRAGGSPAELAELLTGERDFALVTLTPTECAGLLPALAGRRPRTAALAISGETLPGGLLREVTAAAGGVRVVHEYGGADTLPVVSAHEVPRDVPREDLPVPVGRPVPGVERYVLDASGRLCPPGVVGELLVGRTPSAAQPDGPSLVRTGDAGYYLPDGDVVVLGRLGERTAVRGYRVEPARVEAALTRLPSVARALVVPGADGSPAAHVQPAGLGHGGPDDGCTAAALRQELRRVLPEYMLPADFLIVDRLPMAGNAKTARTTPVPGTAPADPVGGEAVTTGTGTMTPMEGRLAAIWKEILGVPSVDPDDDYFDLDGDSITGLRIVSRAADEGIRITPRQLFTHPVLRELAAVAEDMGEAAQADAAGPPAREAHAPGEPVRSRSEDPGPGATIPLAPVQQWFFDLEPAERSHWNQAILLRTTGAADRAVLGEALRRVAGHHTVFRHRFTPPTATAAPRQWHDPAGTAVHLVEESRARAPEDVAEELHASLDLEKGPLLAAAVLPATDDGSGPVHVLLVAHHLVIDFVSWQIVVDDLTTACRQLAAGEDVRLPAFVPYSRWTALLHAHADSAAVRTELDHWAPPGAPERQAGRPVDPGLERDARVVTAELSPEATASLLAHADNAVGTRAQDLLLAATACAVARWTGESRVRIDLERHGRDHLFEGVDPGRTVGWFTVMHPVRLDLPPDPDPLAVFGAVRDELRGVPADGAGYGLLRYAASDPAVRDRMAAVPPATVNFNYLGRMGGLLGAAGQPAAAGALFTTAALGGTADRGPANARPYELEISAMPVGGRMRLRVVHAEAPGRPPAEELLTHLREALTALVVHLSTTAPRRQDMSSGPSIQPAPVTDVTDVTEQVRAAWAAALEQDTFADDEDFFDVGGHSLLAARIMARLSRAVGQRLSLRLFFDNPTVESLSREIEAVVGRAGGEPR
ncbi:condensation domain-containing protein [Streptomyces sp. NPDC001373]|uniref:condensation domain-containing protein n=1 Tax=Streptomyces sp. NPDC001373 TaxID=3364565 RepID=UPI00369917BB